MHKKAFTTTISLIITIIIVAAGVFLVVTKTHNIENDEDKTTLTNNQKNEIEKIKNDQNLVWYEIAELGLRFRVTSDTKNDLGYTYTEHRSFNVNDDYLNVKEALIFSQSETDKDMTGCTLNEESGWGCGWISIDMIKKGDVREYTKKHSQFKFCDENNQFDIGDYYGCVSKSFVKESNVIDDEEYKDIFHISGENISRQFGIYLNTLEIPN